MVIDAVQTDKHDAIPDCAFCGEPIAEGLALFGTNWRNETVAVHRTSCQEDPWDPHWEDTLQRTKADLMAMRTDPDVTRAVFDALEERVCFDRWLSTAQVDTIITEALDFLDPSPEKDRLVATVMASVIDAVQTFHDRIIDDILSDLRDGLTLLPWALLQGYPEVCARILDRFGTLSHTQHEQAAAELARQFAAGYTEPVLPAVRALQTIEATNRQLRDITADVLTALDAANDPPEVFVRGGALARVRTDESGRAIIDTMTESQVRARAALSASFVAMTAKGTSRDILPPLSVIQNVMAQTRWPFPPLEAITASPVLRPDGSILSTPGYDSLTRLFYIPPHDFCLPPVANEPSQADAAAAIERLAGVLSDFPFVDAASRANALALILTPVIRQAIRGNAPLALIDAPQAGTGKSLLASLVSIIPTGRLGAVSSAPRDDEEFRKRITALLSEGVSFVVFDNLEGVLDAPSLAAALTSDIWQDRVLGRTLTIVVPQRATWVATGNNVRLAGDIPRRCYWIRLDAKESRPWKRVGFKHTDLPGWTMANRAELLAASLTVARAWFVAGKPKAVVPVTGGFTEWATTVGGVLAYAGVEGFLENLELMYDEVDGENLEWESFLREWLSVYGDQAVTVNHLECQMRDRQAGDLRELLPGNLDDAWANPTRSFSRVAGRAFASKADVRFGDDQIRLERVDRDSHTKLARYRVTSGR